MNLEQALDECKVELAPRAFASTALPIPTSVKYVLATILRRYRDQLVTLAGEAVDALIAALEA